MDLDGFKHADTIALQGLLMITTASAAVRIACILLLDDMYEIWERWKKHRGERKGDKEPL